MKKLFYIFLLFICSGCWLTQSGESYMPASLSPVELVGVVDVVSIINTDKTLLDHAGSMVSGYDCSTPRAELTGGAWCIKKPAPYVTPPAPLCYRTLADVDCYPAKVGDPYQPDRLPIGSNQKREVLGYIWN